MSARGVVVIDGRPVPLAQAQVPVADRGFAYGHGVFESLRAHGSHAEFLPHHIERLRAGAAAIGIGAPPEPREVRAAVAAALSALGVPRAYVRLVVTAGSSPFELIPSAPLRARLIVIAVPWAPPTPALFDTGLAVARVDSRELGGPWKTLAYLPNLLAARAGRAVGADEALLVGRRDELLRGASSNLLLVADDRVIAPGEAVGVRAGVTRAVLLACAHQEGLESFDRGITAADLDSGTDLVVASSLRGPVWVRQIDERRFREQPSARLARWFEAYSIAAARID